MPTTELLRIYSIYNGYLVSSSSGEEQNDEFYDDISEVLVHVAQLAGDSADAAVVLQQAYQDQRDTAFAELDSFKGRLEGTTILPELEPETEEGYDTDTIV